MFPGKTQKKQVKDPGISPGNFPSFVSRVSGKTHVSFQETGKKSGNLPGNPGFFLHLIRISGGYKIPNRKTGENPRSYQRSREKLDSLQESREKTDLTRFLRGEKPSKKTSSDLSGVFRKGVFARTFLCSYSTV